MAKKTSILHDIFASTGDGRASISKIAMIVGLIVGSYVVINQAYQNGISYDIFAIYMMCTLGANSVNKAISVIQNIKESKYSHAYGSPYQQTEHSYTAENQEDTYDNHYRNNPEFTNKE